MPGAEGVAVLDGGEDRLVPRQGQFVEVWALVGVAHRLAQGQREHVAYKEHTGQLSSGLYFLAVVMVFGLVLTGVVYNRLERRQRQASVNIATDKRAQACD